MKAFGFFCRLFHSRNYVPLNSPTLHGNVRYVAYCAGHNRYAFVEEVNHGYDGVSACYDLLTEADANDLLTDAKLITKLSTIRVSKTTSGRLR